MRAGTLKWMWTISGFLLFLILFLLSGNANALPSADVTYDIGWSINLTDNLSITPLENSDGKFDRYKSYSNAKVDYDPDGPDNTITIKDQQKAAGNTDAQAPIDETVAGASSVNTIGNTVGTMSGSARAQGQLGIKNKAESKAEQGIYFAVQGTGTLDLTIDYYFKQEISVDAGDEWAKAYSKLEWELGNWFVETDEWGNEKIKKADDKVKDKIEFKAEDLTGDFTEASADPLKFSYTFVEGNELGFFFKIKTKNKAEAYIAPVPEPATMILFGSGLICLAGLRRRFKK